MLLFLALVVAVTSPEGRTLDWQLNVEGAEREALVYVPVDSAKAKGDANSTAFPVVFAFHGHGGNARNAQRSFHLEKLWPEAIVVYMQGLPTPGRLTDPEGKKNGWQGAVGEQSDRDLKFFDAVLKKLRSEHRVDDSRIFSMGHSNGGGFTYLLWEARADEFAAFAPSASAAGRRQTTLKPKPVLHIAGKNDELVKFEWQQASIKRLIASNSCSTSEVKDKNMPWVRYPSENRTPVMTYIHEGTHKYPSEAPEITVQFFKAEPWREQE